MNQTYYIKINNESEYRVISNILKSLDYTELKNYSYRKSYDYIWIGGPIGCHQGKRIFGSARNSMHGEEILIEDIGHFIKKEVAPPKIFIKKIDGEKFEVFFNKDSISIGRDFFRKDQIIKIYIFAMKEVDVLITSIMLGDKVFSLNDLKDIINHPHFGEKRA